MSHVAADIHIIGRHKQKVVWNTHYPGDVRTANGVADMYFLKSQVVIGEAAGGFIEEHGFVSDDDGKIWPVACEDDLCSLYEYVEFGQKGYDRVIDCTGWAASLSMVLDHVPQAGNRKFPELRGDFSSVSHPHLYFAGAVAHGIDHKQSSGGFVHGFRYTAKALGYILYEKLTGMRAWEHNVLEWNMTEIVASVQHRLNTADGMYQMFGYVADVLLPLNNSVVQLYDVPTISLRPVVQRYAAPRVIAVTLEYGPNAKSSDPFNHSLLDTEDGEKSVFLHPVIRLYHVEADRLREGGRLHIPENLWSIWSLQGPQQNHEGQFRALLEAMRTSESPSLV